MLKTTVADAVGRIDLDRPDTRNALSRAMIAALSEALDQLERDPAVRVVLLTGTPWFCAGADIAEMHDMTLQDALADNFSGCCDRLAACTKPVIAAIEGYALGGGCELIEMCDVVIAAEDARFGHPEIKLGTLSGAGGTQRLARAVGRAKAMDLILTGRLIEASEAERIGLISRVVAKHTAVAAALDVARDIASRPVQATQFAKQAVDHAVSAGLAEGLRLERRLFHLTFATGDLQQGMQAFIAGRKR
jgi:enoyl-CoA hydratase